MLSRTSAREKRMRETSIAKPLNARGRPSRTPLPPREYLTRRELLSIVPLSRTTIDDLERRGEFPSRFVLTPTNRVAWKRSEVVKFLRDRAKRRVHRLTPAEANATD